MKNIFSDFNEEFKMYLWVVYLCQLVYPNLETDIKKENTKLGLGTPETP